MNDEDPIRDVIEYITESICTGYVLLATVNNGTMTSFYWKAQQEQPLSTTIGLLEAASAAEKYRAAKILTAGEFD